jgi:hypothetical protein
MVTTAQRVSFVNAVNERAAEMGAEFPAVFERYPSSSDISTILIESLVGVANREYAGNVPPAALLSLALDWDRSAADFRRDSDLNGRGRDLIRNADGFAGAVGYLLGMLDNNTTGVRIVN